MASGGNRQYLNKDAIQQEFLATKLHSHDVPRLVLSENKGKNLKNASEAQYNENL